MSGTLLDLYKLASDDNKRSRGEDAAIGLGLTGAGIYGTKKSISGHNSYKEQRKANLNDAYVSKKDKNVEGIKKRIKGIKEAKWWQIGKILDRTAGAHHGLQKVLDNDKTLGRKIMASKAGIGAGVATALAGGDLLYDVARNRGDKNN